MRKRLFGILVLVVVPILGFGLGITAAAAGTARAATPARAAHLSGVRIEALPQFRAALKKVREAGRGVALRTGIPAAYARSPAESTPDIPTPANVCVPNSANQPTQCINDWNGNLTNLAQAARFYHYGNSGGHNEIYFEFVHTIDTASGSDHFEPFADGSGLNTAYNGRPVYALQWMTGCYPYDCDTGVCIAGDAADANPFNYNCNSGSDTLYYAWSKYSALISVGASNNLYEAGGGPNRPVWLGSNSHGNTGNGAPIFLTTVQNNNLPWYIYQNGG